MNQTELLKRLADAVILINAATVRWILSETERELTEVEVEVEVIGVEGVVTVVAETLTVVAHDTQDPLR